MKKITSLGNVKYVMIAFAFVIIPFSLFAQIPSGFIAKFPFDNNSPVDASGSGYDATFSGSVTDLNRFGTANSAVAFTQGTSKGSFPLSLASAVQTDFSIGFWFKTTMAASSHPQWYGGNALIDAEMGGVTADWGMALIDGGKVSLGIGNSDITIKSPLNTYNDGSWHFVTATRNAAAGTIRLYMEGVEVVSNTGTYTGALNAPNSIGIGSNPGANAAAYTGSIDDVIFYNRVLSDAEVTALYNSLSASVLPLKWLSFTGTWQKNNSLLQWQVAAVQNNHHFEIESSNDGIRFIQKGSVANNGGTGNTAATSYTFLDNNAATKSPLYYRIKQVDIDGKFTFSKTIKMLAGNGIVKKPTIQSNPVATQLVLLNDNRSQVYQLEIVDASGRPVMNKSVKNAEAVIRTDVQQLKAGFYTVKMHTADGVTVLPWIKQ